jgi:hypothetical protein
MAFDIARHDYPEIYRCYVSVKIRGKSYILEAASPDLEGIPYGLTNESIPLYYKLTYELIDKQLAYNNPMKGASEYRKSDA